MSNQALTDGVQRAIEQMDATQKYELDKMIVGSAHFKTRYRNDHVAFINNCFAWESGDGPTDYQCEIADCWGDKTRDCVRALHGVGKTALGAWRVIHFALVNDGELDWKAITTASNNRQLEKYLWPEIHKWIGKLRWDRIDRKPFNHRMELLTTKIQLRTNGIWGQAFGVASDNPGYIEGAHAAALLYLFDEAKLIIPETWDAAEGAFAGDEEIACALALSTPGEPHGRFYDIQTHKAGYEDWATYHITLEQAIKAGRVSRDWADQRKRQWGENSPMYRNRVLGEFAQQDQDCLIPLAWVEAANERWRALEAAGAFGETDRIGIDVSDGGADDCTIAERAGKAIKTIRCMPKTADPVMALAGVAVGICRKNGASAIVDSIGVGAGTTQRMREQGKEAVEGEHTFTVIGFNASEKTDWRDRSGEMGAINKRAASWWNMREMLDPQYEEDIALPPIDRLTGDLCTPRYRIVSGGKIQVESKDDLRKTERLGRSTDYGDPVVMAYWNEKPILEHWNDADFMMGAELESVAGWDGPGSVEEM